MFTSTCYVNGWRPKGSGTALPPMRTGFHRMVADRDRACRVGTRFRTGIAEKERDIAFVRKVSAYFAAQQRSRFELIAAGFGLPVGGSGAPRCPVGCAFAQTILSPLLYRTLIRTTPTGRNGALRS